MQELEAGDLRLHGPVEARTAERARSPHARSVLRVAQRLEPRARRLLGNDPPRPEELEGVLSPRLHSAQVSEQVVSFERRRVCDVMRLFAQTPPEEGVAGLQYLSAYRRQ